jgi:hypothetical protein
MVAFELLWILVLRLLSISSAPSHDHFVPHHRRRAYYRRSHRKVSKNLITILSGLLALTVIATPTFAQTTKSTNIPGASPKANLGGINVDLRIPQRSISEFVARQLQSLLLGVGCPDWNHEDGRWGPSSAGQFDTFLRKTGQVKQYEAMKQPTGNLE